MANTRDMVIALAAKFEAHDMLDNLRWAETNGKLEKMFTFLKDADEKRDTQLESVMTTLAEQRGAGKIAKLLASAGAGMMGLLGGIGGSHILK